MSADNPARPEVAWLRGRPIAMLHDLPDDTRFTRDVGLKGRYSGTVTRGRRSR